MARSVDILLLLDFLLYLPLLLMLANVIVVISASDRSLHAVLHLLILHDLGTPLGLHLRC